MEMFIVFRFDLKFKFINYNYVTFLLARTSLCFPTFLAMWSMYSSSLQFCLRERLKTYYTLSVWCIVSSKPGPGFFITWQTWIYILDLPVCKPGQYISVSSLIDFFFVPQNLIDRTNSYFWWKAFSETFFSLTSNIHSHKIFQVKINSLHWNSLV